MSNPESPRPVTTSEMLQEEPDIHHPEIEVRLTGRDGNAFSVMGNVTRALRASGVDEEEVAQYRAESTAGDYDNLLRTAMRWVSVS